MRQRSLISIENAPRNRPEPNAVLCLARILHSTLT